MSLKPKEIVRQMQDWQRKKDEEVLELKRITNRFKENERTAKAKEVGFSERLDEFRDRFGHFFSVKNRGVQS